ncbi:MAG TPA: hypothetical protein VND64_12740 [Pirellulales bacterium]|nr:hypothetical protein [Pirellulales bacterium]
MATGTVRNRLTNDPSPDWLASHRDQIGFSPEEWKRFADDDRIALSGISVLLTAIIAMGMVGMLVVVAILAFG